MLSMLLLVGCGYSTAKAEYDPGHLASVIASEVALAVHLTAPDNPQPSPGDVCPNCNGAGKVGDGRVMVECKECGGTGKVSGLSIEIRPIADVPIQEVTYEASPQVCDTGTCPVQPAVLRPSHDPPPPLPYAPHLADTQPVVASFSRTFHRRGLFGRRVQRFCGPGGCR